MGCALGWLGLGAERVTQRCKPGRTHSSADYLGLHRGRLRRCRHSRYCCPERRVWCQHPEVAVPGADFELALPSTRFRRSVGSWSGAHTDPSGKPVSAAEFEANKDMWLPTDEDKTFIHSLMQRVTEPGKMAGWIAPPDCGINANPLAYEYVKL